MIVELLACFIGITWLGRGDAVPQAGMASNFPPAASLVEDVSQHLPRGSELRVLWKEINAAAAGYRLTSVVTLAQKCRKLASASHEQVLVTNCSVMMYDAASRLGDAHAIFLSAARWNQTGRRPELLPSANLRALLKAVPSLVATYSGRPQVLKYVRHSDRGLHPTRTREGIPEVRVSINGMPAVALLDTGASAAVVMDETHASALNARILLRRAATLRVPSDGALSSDRAAIALISSLKLGGLTLRNVSALVVPDESLRAGVLIGLPILARFREIEFTDTEVTLGQGKSRCTRDVPLIVVPPGLLALSTSTGNWLGHHVTAIVDTGAQYAMVAGTTRSGVSVPGASKPPPYLAELRVRLGSHFMTARKVPVMDLGPFVGVAIGSQILDMANVQFSFKKPSLCITERNLVGTVEQ